MTTTRPLSHSARETFGRCERLYFLSEVERLELDVDKPSLRMGKAFAKCNEERNPNAADTDYAAAINAAQSEEAANALDDERTVVRVYSRHYLARYASDWSTDLQREVEFHSPVVGHGFLDGVISKVVIDCDACMAGEAGAGYCTCDQSYVGIEDKLLSPISWREVNERVLKIDNQVTAYFYAMRERGTPLDKLLYRVQIKPGIGRRRIKLPETAAEYEQRLTQYLVDKPELFKQYDVYRTDEELDLFALEAQATNAQVRTVARLATINGADAWPKRTKACSDFGGCAMLSICRKEPGAALKYRRKPDREKPLPKKQQLVLDALRQAFTGDAWGADVARASGLPYDATMSALRGLQRRGKVGKSKVGRSVVWHPIVTAA